MLKINCFSEGVLAIRLIFCQCAEGCAFSLCHPDSSTNGSGGYVLSSFRCHAGRFSLNVIVLLRVYNVSVIDSEY